MSLVNGEAQEATLSKVASVVRAVIDLVLLLDKPGEPRGGLCGSVVHAREGRHLLAWPRVNARDLFHRVFDEVCHSCEYV